MRVIVRGQACTCKITPTNEKMFLGVSCTVHASIYMTNFISQINQKITRTGCEVTARF